MKKIIGAKIREARERAGISQSALGWLTDRAKGMPQLTLEQNYE
jgi:hypothetical protein